MAKERLVLIVDCIALESAQQRSVTRPSDNPPLENLRKTQFPGLARSPRCSSPGQFVLHRAAWMSRMLDSWSSPAATLRRRCPQPYQQPYQQCQRRPLHAGHVECLEHIRAARTGGRDGAAGRAAGRGGVVLCSHCNRHCTARWIKGEVQLNWRARLLQAGTEAAQRGQAGSVAQNMGTGTPAALRLDGGCGGAGTAAALRPTSLHVLSLATDHHRAVLTSRPHHSPGPICRSPPTWQACSRLASTRMTAAGERERIR